ncbi:ATP-dependent DNA ligase [Cryptosporangium arvum]|uniref:DNA ligase (ATP) n=1 Tax=Cryptosporangium arvum DSM 44712 TaxID=927661 RepID=A0A010Z0G0_9ACTN|nr:ATP-dependent DNA ligase [Cryptosporangium arvum]EXG80938.1 ATP-dependent DNA ligase [Cryptosporangium arvum DSM 44712]
MSPGAGDDEEVQWGLPVAPPVDPMLASPVKGIPVGDGLYYEPKFDGFRCLIFREGDRVVLGSRGNKELQRYFPEVVEEVRGSLPERCVVDGELVVVVDDRLDFDALAQRIHPAATRINLLAEQTPAHFIAFDLLALGDESLLEVGYSGRRERLAGLFPADGGPSGPRTHLTPVTTDPGTAQSWFEKFEGAGLDGLIVKAADGPYEPGKRTMKKVKHARTADCVVAGFRWHKSGPIVGSLLLGLYDDEGNLHHVGVSASFTAKRRAELVEELEQYRLSDVSEHPWSAWAEQTAEAPPAGEAVPTRMPGAPSRWTGKKDLSWQPLRPELVVEVAYDHMEGDRFRHTARFERWRPDREPRSCTYAQLDRPVRFDLERVLKGSP